MKKTTIAKLLAAGQFIVTAIGTTVSQQGIPHSLNAWLALIGSALIWMSVHHAASTGGAS